MTGDDFRRALVDSIRTTVDLAYAYSQEIVPVSTGRLKRSGYRRDTPEGAAFGYSAPYATDVDQGHPTRQEHVPAHSVTSHTRQTVRGTVRVAQHRVAAHDRTSPAREGVHFLRRSKDYYEREFPRVLSEKLRSIQ